MKRVNVRIITIDDPAKNAQNLRAKTSISDEQVSKVKAIMDSVARDGDKALIDYTLNFDGIKLDSIRVASNEIDNAYKLVSKEQLRALREIKRRLETAEKAVLNKLKKIEVRFDGAKISKLLKPVESVGCYVPGGKARYPSTAIMCAVPAKVAGVKRIVVCTPPTKDGSVDPMTLVAADLCGVNEIYKVGGAQSIAAMAYGTETIKPVSKIVGPGGTFVTIAKVLASSRVSIDMLAGPTELLVLADESADPLSLALDIVAQSEHSVDTFCGLVTCSKKLADSVANELSNAVSSIDRSEIVSKSLEQNGFIALCKNYNDAVRFTNELAPEHLQLMTKDARKLVGKIESAGLILVGAYTPSAASDYGFGSNHVLPTLAFARSRASLSSLDFVKLVSVVESSKEGLKKIAGLVKLMSESEDLPNHYRAIKARLD
ncbi:MAG: histidinol dehydrogenase [Candidatus Nitrosomirales archaeon]|jgi:histidinol dehydrogenase